LLRQDKQQGMQVLDGKSDNLDGLKGWASG
jgi:hypothetical protein